MEVDLDGLFRQNGSFDYENYETPETGGSEAVWIPVVYSLVFLLGLAGNILLLVVLVRKRLRWSISDIFILHFAVVDILLLLILPFKASHATQHLCERILCKICGAVFNINFYCGVFLLLCITLDHYLSTIHAVRFNYRRTPNVAHISCLMVWVISLLLSIPEWIFLESKEDLEQDKHFCAHNYRRSGVDWLRPSRLLHHILGFLLPVAVLILCLSHIFLRRLAGSKGLQRQRPVMVILPLVGVFLLFWTPYNVTLFINTVINISEKPDSSESTGSLKTALVATSAFGCIHACLRPLLYLLLCPNIKKQVLGLLRCATVVEENSLWQLGVGEEAPHDQSDTREEMKQMTNNDHQGQAVQL
ncbi:C-X-C chemokine receptor type 3-like isoform X2 [Cololabis saira]|nr:C-X-C chemokine receptor type 3-like isoform X2 [Cololabis saira]